MDDQKSFREKKLIEILIVIVVIVFLIGSVIFAFVKNAPTVPKHNSSTSSITQSVLNSLTAHATTTTNVAPSVLNSLSSPKNSTPTTVSKTIINSLTALPKK